MATSSCKALGRLSCRLQALVHNTNTKQSSFSLHFKLKPQSAIVPRFSLTSRLPVELSSLESMLPFYSAVASARLVSSLSIESLGWGLVPQGSFTDIVDEHVTQLMLLTHRGIISEEFKPFVIISVITTAKR